MQAKAETSTARHEILGGLVQVYKRDRSRYWQCSASVDGKQFRASTEEEGLPQAKNYAEDWYLELRGKARAGLLKTGKSFDLAADQFEKEYEVITEGHRSPRWVEGHKHRLRLHLRPFFGELTLPEITPGKVQEYRMHRATTGKARGGNDQNRKLKAPSRSTIHNEIVTLRQVLKTAVRHNWLSHVPDLSPPYRTQGKVVHRPWFSPEEYKQLYTATREYAQTAEKRFKYNAEMVHDFVLFLANTGLRPDEAKNLEHRDVRIVLDKSTREHILEIEVRGKRGVGFCKSMPGAVQPYQRLLKRGRPVRQQSEDGEEKITYVTPKPTDRVFPGNHIKLFNGVLRRSNLKLDRDGNQRTAYSLRHTYICMRLIEGADIYALAKNCRTSVEMIQKFYAAHIKDLLDTAAINVRRSPSSRPVRRKPTARKAQRSDRRGAELS
jgi:integrase